MVLILFSNQGCPQQEGLFVLLVPHLLEIIAIGLILFLAIASIFGIIRFIRRSCGTVEIGMVSGKGVIVIENMAAEAIHIMKI